MAPIKFRKRAPSGNAWISLIRLVQLGPSPTPPSIQSSPFKRSRFRVDLAFFWPKLAENGRKRAKTNKNRPQNRLLRWGLDRKGGGGGSVAGWETHSPGSFSSYYWSSLLKFEGRSHPLVAQSSATGVTVAATPPCSAIRFRNPKVPRYRH